ncbi:tyrosine-type recombinase/integrase [Mesorhizobium sp. IMUNJ 23232]|uniref:tyrosine-type recombinase/integrase n=1 Tax=Mesorhizobium sp. IMUNJ 23232 TaxID=3376064 RepID=UPI003788BFFD
MPKIAKELNALAVRRLTEPGVHAVGGVSGLMLQITPTGARSWLLRTTIYDPQPRRCEIGLGSYPETSLEAARDHARKAKQEISDGGNPIYRKRLRRQQARQRITFDAATEQYLASKLDEFRNEKHKAQWKSTLDTYAKPVLGSRIVGDIDVHDVERMLKPIWLTKTETATRVRQRYEAVIGYAIAKGFRNDANPARWKGNLDAIMPQATKVATKDNQPAIQLKDAATWFAALRNRDGVSARALEFLTLTAARSGEVRGMQWDEIDFDANLWTVPASRMKAKREHRVPLTVPAVAILKAIQEDATDTDSPYVFAAARGGMLSDMSISAVMRRMHESSIEAGGKGWLDGKSKRPAVPHGLRSTFRDWAGDHSEYPQEMAEMALSHTVGNKVEAAYRRSDMFEKRRAMMADWAGFIGATS